MAIVKEIEISEPILGKHTIAFDEHAIRRMKERKITEQQVVATLSKPDIEGLPADPGHVRVRRHYGSNTSVDVVYEVRKDKLLVVTAIRVTRKD